MDKPHEIELLEKFLRVRRTLGKSEEEIIQMLENCFLWFAEKRLLSKIHSAMDKLALAKLGELIKEGISEEVREILTNE